MMKNIYILMIGLFSLLTYSCVKNNGNEFKPDLAVPVVKGFEKAYSVYSFQDALNINPEVADEKQYDFYWTVFSVNYSVSAGVVPRGDTLSRTKQLKYDVVLNPGNYFLIFNIKNKATGVTQMVTSNLSVSTLTMTGWYLLKENNNKTDFDFIYPTGRIDNWMAFYNNGQSLDGKAMKSVFSASFKIGLTSTNLYNVMIAVSDQDVGIFRLDNGKRVMGFDNMFFTKPDVKKPQSIFQPAGDQFVFLVNDNKLYTLNKGGFFAAPPVSNYKISPVGAVGARSIFFDENSKSILFSDNGFFATLGESGNSLKNMNADLFWASGYQGARGIGLLLFRRPNGEGIFVKINVSYGPMAGFGDLISATKTLPQTHGLMSADAIGGNYDSDYVYFAKGNKIYMTDFASLSEDLQVTLPAGEVVTSIQHIKNPQPISTSVVIKTDFLAISSYANGRYKVWLHKISSIGTIQALDKPNFEGEGRIKSINYVEQGSGNRTY